MEQITKQPTIDEQTIEKVPPRVKFGQTLFLVLICAGVTGCEWVFTYQSPALGIGIGLGLVIAIYIVLSVAPLEERISRSAESLSLIPLYILFTSSLPWYFLQQQYLIPAVYSCILALCAWHIYRHNLDLKKMFLFNRQSVLKYSILAFTVALFTGTLEYYILRPLPSSPSFEVIYLLRDTVYMVLFVGLGEEVLFRALIQQDLINLYGWKWGLFGASTVFAIMHMTWKSVPELFFVLLAALLMGGLYVRTKSLVPSIVLHAVNNIMLVSALPFMWKLSAG